MSLRIGAGIGINRVGLTCLSMHVIGGAKYGIYRYRHRYTPLPLLSRTASSNTGWCSSASRRNGGNRREFVRTAIDDQRAAFASVLMNARRFSSNSGPTISSSSNNNSNSDSSTTINSNNGSNINSKLNNINSNKHENSSGGEGSSKVERTEDNSTKGKLKLMWKKYGYIFIGTYLAVYASTLSGIFVLGRW